MGFRGESSSLGVMGFRRTLFWSCCYGVPGEIVLSLLLSWGSSGKCVVCYWGSAAVYRDTYRPGLQISSNSEDSSGHRNGTTM